MPTAQHIDKFVYEGATRTITVTSSVNTTGQDVSALLVKPNGTLVLLGTGTGAAPNTPFQITVDLSATGVVPGVNDMVLVVDYGVAGLNKVIFPDDDNEDYQLMVRDNPAVLQT